MEKSRIVTELFLERPSYKEMSNLANEFAKDGVTALVMPPEERGINTHLIIENADLPKVRTRVKTLGIRAIEKEVLLVPLENKPGSLADTTRRIAENGVNLLYVFSVNVSPSLTYVLISTADNKKALKALP